MALQQVRSFRSSDGTLFEEKKPAVVHESKIAIRGFFQKLIGPGAGNASITPSQAANLVQDHLDEFFTLISKSRDQIRRSQVSKK